MTGPGERDGAGVLAVHDVQRGDQLTLIALPGVTRLAAIMPAHSHHDHAMDTVVVAARTGVVIIGSESTADIAVCARGVLYSVCPIAFFTRATSSGEAEASLLASAWG
jgi:L-ascorbate metabolism protein UlaG (beta-lactamase superfamily)